MNGLIATRRMSNGNHRLTFRRPDWLEARRVPRLQGKKQPHPQPADEPPPVDEGLPGSWFPELGATSTARAVVTASAPPATLDNGEGLPGSWFSELSNTQDSILGHPPS